MVYILPQCLIYVAIEDGVTNRVELILASFPVLHFVFHEAVFRIVWLYVNQIQASVHYMQNDLNERKPIVSLMRLLTRYVLANFKYISKYQVS